MNEPTHCDGCRENFYNGNNDLGVQRCWSLDTAKVVERKFVHFNDVPPWNRQPVETTFSCHRRKGHVSVSPDNPSCFPPEA